MLKISEYIPSLPHVQGPCSIKLVVQLIPEKTRLIIYFGFVRQIKYNSLIIQWMIACLLRTTKSQKENYSYLALFQIIEKEKAKKFIEFIII